MLQALVAFFAIIDPVGNILVFQIFSEGLVLTFIAFAAAGWVFRLAGEALLKLMARIVGILLFAIAVDFIVDGVIGLIGQT